LGSSDPLLICTNMFCNENLSSECKNFMKHLLTPNKNFSEYLNEKNKSYTILSSPYSIMHFRLGDDEFFTKNQTDESKLSETMNLLKKYAEPSDILMTDSFRFKQYLNTHKINIAMFNTRPLHLGEFSTMFTEVAASFKETLYEFFTLSTASKIKTHSVYDWVSGFVKFSSLIYDVPLIDLKIQNAPIISSAPIISAPIISAPIISAPIISAPIISAPKPSQPMPNRIQTISVPPPGSSAPTPTTSTAFDHIIVKPIVKIKIKSQVQDSVKKSTFMPNTHFTFKLR
jgi:hypothetical protein